MTTCEHDIALVPDDYGFCCMCLRARLQQAERERDELRAEVARLSAVLLAGLQPNDCEVCFGEGEELHLKADGTLYETGACKACAGTGSWRAEDNQ